MRVFDKSGEIVDIVQDQPVNDLTRAPVFQDELPEDILYLPVVVPSNEDTPRIALVDPSLVPSMDDLEDRDKLRARSVYSSTAATQAQVGPSSSARSTMLPPDMRTGEQSFTIPANTMLNGSHVLLEGEGLLGAAAVNPGAFSLVPWVKHEDEDKIDLPGFSYAPLLGADGTCQIRVRFMQTKKGIRIGGSVRYGTRNSQPYFISINPGTIDALPTVVESDPTVDRVFGIDGKWASSSSKNYVFCRSTSAILYT